MKATYVTITELEMDELFKDSKGWYKTVVGGEYVYSYTMKKRPDVDILVYSSVTPSGVSRKCGGDAIRVCAVNNTTKRGFLKSKRINRTQGWDKRVQERVMEIINNL